MSGRVTTKDQKIFRANGQLKAMIDVSLTHERVEGEKSAPSIVDCRHAVLHIKNDGHSGHGWVVYDRLLCRIVDGVYYRSPESALGVAQYYNESLDAIQDGSPNGLALGLIYPEVRKDKNVPIAIFDE